MPNDTDLQQLQPGLTEQNNSDFGTGQEKGSGFIRRSPSFRDKLWF